MSRQDTHLRWVDIVRLGLVQSALGSVVALTTSTLNRVMVVEFALPAMVPAALVAWHYAVQLSRPKWGHAADVGRARTPWVILGMSMLALGGVLAVNATLTMASALLPGLLLGVAAFTLIGAGVGAAGTSVLAILAAQAAPARRPAAAATTWVMMILGIVLTAGLAGAALDPFTPQRLALVSGGVSLIAFVVASAAIWGVERKRAVPAREAAPARFRAAMAEIWADRRARLFTGFVFVSMLAYSAQDLILEPFAGLIFKMSPGQSTQLSGVQHAGVLAGMVALGALGGLRGGHEAAGMRVWTVAGCLGSGVALAALAFAPFVGAAFPLTLAVFLLGLCNGLFAVAAIGSMMALAGEGGGGKEGSRMGLWGAAQAVAFGLGGFLGAAGVDALRGLLKADAPAFAIVFGLEAMLFAVAAALALRAVAVAGRSRAMRLPSIPTEVAAGG